MRFTLTSIIVLLTLSSSVLLAAPAAKPGYHVPPPNGVDHVEVKVKPNWVWVASVKSDSLTNATLALARANIAAVFEVSPVEQLYVHPDDEARAASTLRKDAATKHYKIHIGVTPDAKTKKPSH